MAAKGSISERIRSWCAYQERSQHETRTKLRTLGIFGDEAEAVIADLISENYLNEERFAIALAGGKFRVRHWGRIRIVQELRRHKVSEHCVKAALEAIPESDYQRAIRSLAQKKLAAVNGTDRRKKFYTASRYLIGKGFEPDLVISALNELLGEISEYGSIPPDER